jgi:hypothetical protein
MRVSSRSDAMNESRSSLMPMARASPKAPANAADQAGVANGIGAL